MKKLMIMSVLALLTVSMADARYWRNRGFNNGNCCQKSCAPACPQDTVTEDCPPCCTKTIQVEIPTTYTECRTIPVQPIRKEVNHKHVYYECPQEADCCNGRAVASRGNCCR